MGSSTTTARTTATGNHIVEGFDTDDPKPIPGFAGLQLLIGNDDEKGKAYYLSQNPSLWPMTSSLDVVSNEDMISGDATKDFVVATLLGLKRMGLENETSLMIAERALANSLWQGLKSYATKDLGDGEGGSATDS